MDAVTEEDVLAAAGSLMVRDRLCITMHAPGRESQKAAASLQDLDF
jgi:hypothetical protein